MKSCITVLLLWAFTGLAHAQQQFITTGKIEFEKRVNLHKTLLLEEDENWRNMFIKSVPATKTTYFDLYFDGNKTLYKPGREVPVTQKTPEWIEGPANDNIVFTNLENRTFNSQKTVFESVFNISDSVPPIAWKITPDTRTIANLECRKATAIIMDSLYVIAFYTDQVVTNGGPESFNGLPGMILGLAIPRLNTTWFATKLELVNVTPANLLAPKKGKKTTLADLKTQLRSSLKDWGKWGDKNLWQVVI